MKGVAVTISQAFGVQFSTFSVLDSLTYNILFPWKNMYIFSFLLEVIYSDLRPEHMLNFVFFLGKVSLLIKMIQSLVIKQLRKKELRFLKVILKRSTE